MAELVLKVNGVDYAGWTAARVKRSIEAIAGSFELEVVDRWTEAQEPWPIFEEDECSLSIDGQELIRGWVDKRSIMYAANSRAFVVSGRDRTAALVDCSVDLRQWEFRRVPLFTLARRLTEPFQLPVSLQGELTLPPPPPKISIDPGDSCFEALELACRAAGVLPVCDGAGGLRLTRAGETRCSTELVEGENILAASAEYDATGRFARYVVTGQSSGSDALWGEAAARVRAEARDENVRRKNRVLVIRPGSTATPAYARQRAAWEATVRAARSRRVRVAVQGWHQGDGTLWPVNALVRVRSPSIGVDDELLIGEVTFTLSEGEGTTTELVLAPAEAFRPEPVIPEQDEAGKFNFAPAPVQSEGP